MKRIKEISADRLYDEEGEPLYYHLKMFGLHYPDDYELLGYDLDALMREAIRDCEKSMREYKKASDEVR